MRRALILVLWLAVPSVWAIDPPVNLAQCETATEPHGTGTFECNFTAVEGTVLVAAVVANAELTISDIPGCLALGAAGLTWVAQPTSAFDDGTDDTTVRQWVAEVGVGQGGANTAVVDCDDESLFSAQITIDSLSGYLVGDPVGATLTGTVAEKPAVDDFSVTLDAAPATTSIVIATVAVVSDTLNIVGGMGWTEHTDYFNEDGFTKFQTQYRTASTSTDVSWTTITSSLSSVGVASAVEIQSAVGSNVLLLSRKLPGRGNWQ